MSNLSMSAHPNIGGMHMRAHDYWTIFLETGAPELYLMFNQARRMEETDVSEDQGTGTACNRLQ